MASRAQGGEWVCLVSAYNDFFHLSFKRRSCFGLLDVAASSVISIYEY